MSLHSNANIPSIVLAFEDNIIDEFKYQKLILSFDFNALDFDPWKQCSLISNFLASYYSASFSHNSKLISCLSTLFNELIENAVKFRLEHDSSVLVKLFEESCQLHISVQNLSSKVNAEKLSTLLSLIKDTDLDTLYQKQVLHNMQHATKSSEIGLISLVKDYEVKLGAKFSNQLNDMVMVEVFIRLDHIFLDSLC